MTKDWMTRNRCSTSSPRSASLYPSPAQSTSNLRTIEWPKSIATSEVIDSACGVGWPGMMSRPRNLSSGNHSRAVATASAMASAGSVIPRRCAANRSRNPLAACTAAAINSASVLGK
jgi:hypothetical protein